MKIGFATAMIFDGVELEEIVPWAASEGFNTIEVACWPDMPAGKGYGGIHKDLGGTHHIRVEDFDSKKAEQVKKLFKDNKMEISSLAYYPNNLDPNLKDREICHNHLMKVIDAASILGVEYVGTFVGGDKHKSIEENLKEFEKVFPEKVEYAEKKNVKLMIENCPMHVLWPTGYNIAFSPAVWEKMFNIIPSKSFGLNYDPSHLVYQMIDYLAPIKEFSERVFHIHAKDMEIFYDILEREGIYSDFAVEGFWWRPRVPGSGDMNWKKFIDLLYEVNYDGVLSLEHDDPTWHGSYEKIKKGLVIGKKYLEDILKYFS